MTRPPVRVVLADDHPTFRYGLRTVLDDAPEIEVVGEAASGRELLDVVAATQPDVVLTDLGMPDLDGAAATHQLLTRQPTIAVLVLTMHDDDESVFAALRAGALGYLLKGADGPELVRAVLAVAAGDAVYGAPVARQIVAFYSGAHQRYAAQAFPDLTPRERDVLDLLAAGARNHEIARRLGLSEKTIRNHVSALLLKPAGARPHRCRRPRPRRRTRANVAPAEARRGVAGSREQLASTWRTSVPRWYAGIHAIESGDLDELAQLLDADVLAVPPQGYPSGAVQPVWQACRRACQTGTFQPSWSWMMRKR
jgi:DNA-binding NarL/FixJ family response regulator